MVQSTVTQSRAVAPVAQQAVELLGVRGDGHGVIVGDGVDWIRSTRLASIVHMPSCWFVVITFRSWLVLPSRMRFRTGLLATRISKAATMPPPIRRHQPLGDHGAEARGELDADLLLAEGREHVDDAVDRLGGIVGVQGREDEVTGLGQVSASWIDSRSRISPTRRTSGSSRRAERRARSKDGLSSPISRWLTAERLWSWTYSTGSSMVRM